MILNTKELKERLNIVGATIGNQGYQKCILFDNGVIKSTNGTEVTLTSIEVSENPGKKLIPFKIINDIINKVSSTTIDIDLSDNPIKLKADRSRFKINCLGDDEFPNNLKIEEGNKSALVGSNEFKDVIKKSIIACASECLNKPILSGINISFNNGTLKCVATDSYRLSSSETNYIDHFNNSFSITIPKKFIVNLLKILPDGVDLNISANDGYVVFTFEVNGQQVIYQCSLLNGVYPDCNKLINAVDSNENITKINKKELLAAIDRVSVVVDNATDKDKAISTNKILIQLKDNQLSVRTFDDNTQGKAIEIIDCPNNIDIEFGTNYKYLIEALNTFDEDVSIITSIENRPFRFENESRSNIQLILPFKK